MLMPNDKRLKLPRHRFAAIIIATRNILYTPRTLRHDSHDCVNLVIILRAKNLNRLSGY